MSDCMGSNGALMVTILSAGATERIFKYSVPASVPASVGATPPQPVQASPSTQWRVPPQCTMQRLGEPQSAHESTFLNALLLINPLVMEEM